MEPMEMETLHPRPASERSRPATRQHPIDQLWMLIKLYMELHPILASIILFAALGVFAVFVVEALHHPEGRHRISHDYSKLANDYNFKASQIDHWCLFGGDDECTCDDFTVPIDRGATKDWGSAHELNKDLAKQRRYDDYDVVFYGDDTVEMWNGRWLGKTVPANPNGPAINDFFNKTFVKEKGAKFDGLALGIKGDNTANLLWRLQNGELPSALTSKIWWINIGTNDLARGGCSEEATVLGILRIAEEIHFHKPEDIIVLQAILPRSNRLDGSLGQKSSTFGLFNKVGRGNSQDDNLLWPSIVSINEELRLFCEKHTHMVYFDANKLFLGSIGNEFYKHEEQVVIHQLMYDYVHLSEDGYKLMGNAIAKEVDRIIYQEDETNDVEPPEGGRLR